MKTISLSCLAVSGSLLVSTLAVAQVTPPTVVEPPSSSKTNRFGLSYRLGFNVSANFSGLGGYHVNPVPSPSGGDTDRTYDDGYNRRDISPSDGMTWYWGYQDYPRQIVDDTLRLSVASAEADGVSRNNDDDPLHGFEFTYLRLMRAYKKWSWGLEFAFNYTCLGINDRRPITGPLTIITDSYPTFGSIPPHAPEPDMAYEGTHNGPGMLIGDTPTRLDPTVIPDGLVVNGRRELEASIYGFRLGPYAEYPLSKTLSLSLSSGLALALVDGEFEFSETAMIVSTGATAPPRSGHDSQFEAMVGWFVAGQITWALDEKWSLFSGVQYQDVGHYSLSANGAEAKLDLSRSIFVTVGVNYSF